MAWPTLGWLLAIELARFVTALHGIDSTGGPPASRGVPLKKRDQSTRAAIDALQGEIDTGAVTAATATSLGSNSTVRDQALARRSESI